MLSIALLKVFQYRFKLIITWTCLTMKGHWITCWNSKSFSNNPARTIMANYITANFVVNIIVQIFIYDWKQQQVLFTVWCSEWVPEWLPVLVLETVRSFGSIHFNYFSTINAVTSSQLSHYFLISRGWKMILKCEIRRPRDD